MSWETKSTLKDASFAASELDEADLKNNQVIFEQVDILISKNQALQILYLKHCVHKIT